jgi:hypothetical protein
VDDLDEKLVPVLGGLLLAAAVVVAILKVWPRRPLGGGEKRCGSCGYSRAGLSGERCPECGREPGTRSPLQLTWVVLIGLLLLVGGQLAQWSIRRGEPLWMRLVPTTALCVAERVSPSQEGGSRERLLGRRLDGDGLGLQARLAFGGRIPREALERSLIVPGVWVEGEPIVVRTMWVRGERGWEQSLPRAVRWSLVAECELNPRDLAGLSLRPSYIECGMSSGGIDEIITLPAQPVGEFVVPIRLRVTMADATVIDKVVHKTVKIVPRGTPILKPVSNDAVAQRLMEQSVSVSTRYLTVSPPSWMIDDLAVGVKVELFTTDGRRFGLKQTEGDEPVLAAIAPDPSMLGSGKWFCLPPEFCEEDPDAERKTPIPENVILRITGDELASLRLVCGGSYWTGSVEMPLAEWARRNKAWVEGLQGGRKP